MSKFKIGDVCIFQNAKYFPELNGEEVTIVAIGVVGIDNLTGVPIGGVYGLDKPCKNGGKWCAHEYQLRLKHPPAADDETAHLAMLDCIERAKRGVEVSA